MEKSQFMIGDRPVDVWPEEQAITPLDHPTIVVTRFLDTDLYHPGLVAGILEKEREGGRNYFRGACGTKVHQVDQWGFVEADLIHARAVELYRRALSARQAVVDWSWASVYREGDHCMPHSHLRANASIVYFLEPGEPDPDDPLAGSFYFADPRLPCCCQKEAGRVTSLYRPELEPGSMLIFPAQLVHSVNSYRGTRPRITMSWNIGATNVAGTAVPDGG
ncbi:MAG: putative 2OG-Fe(II) oxygenase [Arenicellales bacterium]